MQRDFADPMPDILRKDTCILVAIDMFSKYPITKVVTTTTTNTAIKFMQRNIMRNGVRRRIRCDQAQTLRAKKFQVYSKYKKVKLLFASVDNHRALGLVDHLIQNLKTLLTVMRTDPKNTPCKQASDVAELIKTLRVTPQAGTKLSPFEIHTRRRQNTIISNLAATSTQNN